MVQALSLESSKDSTHSLVSLQQGVSTRAGVVNSVVAIVIAQALIEKSTDEHLECIDLISSIWTHSLFQRMGFVKCMHTTGKSEIPDRAVMEAKLLFQHQIASLVEEHNIPPSLIMNCD